MKPPGQGSIRRDGRNCRRIFVSFDDETFEQIRAHAMAGGLSFTGAVRELVEWGLLDATDQRAARVTPSSPQIQRHRERQ